MFSSRFRNALTQLERVQGAKLPGMTSVSWSWPAMHVISLGIRTVPVLSVAKKLAAPRPTPTALAAKCGLIGRMKRTDYDCRLG